MQRLLVYVQETSDLPRRDVRYPPSSEPFLFIFHLLIALIGRLSARNSPVLSLLTWSAEKKICCGLEDPPQTPMDHWQAPAKYNRSMVLFPHHTLVLRTKAFILSFWSLPVASVVHGVQFASSRTREKGSLQIG